VILGYVWHHVFQASSKETIDMIKKFYQVFIILFFSAFIAVTAIYADDVKVYPTLPGTSIRDYSQPGVKIEGDNAYPTLPGTNLRDYSKPGHKIDP
jgi:hypothetical protein